MGTGTFVENVKINATAPARAASTVDVTGTWVNTAGFTHHTFSCAFVSTAATQYLKVQGAASTTGGADLLGTKVTLATAGDRVAAVELVDTRFAYLRGVAFVGASVVGPEMMCYQSNPRNASVSQPANVGTPEVHINPTTGTA